MAMQNLSDKSVPLHEIIARRWSSRAFSEQAVEADKLRSVLEAARWAPSSRNEQPWAYVVATREDSAQYEALSQLLMEANRAWANKAPVLVLTLAHSRLEKTGQPNRHALHDLGLSTANLVAQATSLGLMTHQMGGFDVEAARTQFAVPEGWEPVSMIALGYPGKAESLPDSLRARETAPRQRKPLNEFVFSEKWGHPSPISEHDHDERTGVGNTSN
jgi:nitroreductase